MKRVVDGRDERGESMVECDERRLLKAMLRQALGFRPLGMCDEEVEEAARRLRGLMEDRTKCPYCGFRTKTAKALMIHLCRIHRDELVKLLKRN